MGRLLRLAFALGALVGCHRPSPAPSTAQGYLTTADSVRLYYRTVGDGPRTAIAPLASLLGNTLDSLGKDLRLILFDPRGRGRSDTVSAPKISLGANLADVDAVRAHFGIDTTALIGWSGYGMEMFVYALRHPGVVTRLVQLAPVALTSIYSDSLAHDRARRTDSTANGTLARQVAAGAFAGDPVRHCRAAEAVSRPATFGDLSMMSRAPDVCEFPTEWPARLAGYFGAFFPSIAGWDWRDSLSAVVAPRLVIHGALDNTPLAGNRLWVAGQSAARLVVIEGAGHWPQVERNAETLGAIRVFLAGRWPARAVAYP